MLGLRRTSNILSGGVGGLYNGVPFIKNRRVHTAHKTTHDGQTFLTPNTNQVGIQPVAPPTGKLKRKSGTKIAIKPQGKMRKLSVAHRKQMGKGDKAQKSKTKKRSTQPKDRF